MCQTGGFLSAKLWEPQEVTQPGQEWTFVQNEPPCFLICCFLYIGHSMGCSIFGSKLRFWAIYCCFVLHSMYFEYNFTLYICVLMFTSQCWPITGILLFAYMVSHIQYQTVIFSHAIQIWYAQCDHFETTVNSGSSNQAVGWVRLCF